MSTTLPPLTTMTPGDAELVEAFTTYMRSRAFSENTLKRRRHSLTRLAVHQAPGSILTVQPGDIDLWVSRLRSARTKHAYRSDVAVFFKWAVRRGLVESNPIDKTDAVRIPKTLPKPARAESIAAAFRVGGATVQLALMLGALAGLRAGEIVRLDSADIHLESDPPSLIVREGKWGKDRVVPLHPRLVGMLRGQTGWIFPNGLGGHLSYSALQKQIGRVMLYLEQAGLEPFSMHKLRSYFATEAARLSHGDVVLVGALLGHESPNTTMQYIKPHLVDGAEIIAGITGGQATDELAARRLRMA